MLQPPIRTFRASKFCYLAWAICGPGLTLWLIWTAVENGARPPIFAGIAAWGSLAVFFLLWLLSIRLRIHPDGISWTSCLTNKEMRWDGVRHFYCSAQRVIYHGIPVPTTYYFCFVGLDGVRLRFGNSVEKPKVVAAALIDVTTQTILWPAAERFNRGEEIDFGPIKLSRSKGICLRRIFRTVEIPLEQLEHYGIDGGYFWIRGMGQKLGTYIGLYRLPNAFVLQVLLDAIFPAAHSTHHDQPVHAIVNTQSTAS